MNRKCERVVESQIGKIALAVALLASVPAFAATGSESGPFFIPGNLIVYVEGCGVWGNSVPANPPSNGVTGTGTCTSVPGGIGTGFENSSVNGYGDNQAGPGTLFQFSVNGTSSVTYINSLTLPQNNSGANSAFSGEYGSQSEGNLHLSGTSQYLTVGGYGVNAAAYDTNPSAYGNVGVPPTDGLAQTGSLLGQSYTPVPRVIALIDANGNVNTSTVVYNIFNADNPRSAYTENGTTAYFSGQGTNCDFTAGVFYLPATGLVNTAPVSITYGDTLTATYAKGGTPCNQDTRDVQIYNGSLYVTLDSTAGKSNNRSYVGWFGSGTLPTTAYNTGASYAGPNPSGGASATSGPTMLPGLGNGGTVTAGTISGGTGKYTMTTSVVDDVTYSLGNGLNAGLQINLSPESFFFANPSTLYVTDGGDGKQSSATSAIGDGGLQKWINTKPDGSGTWNLAYTLYQGLNLVLNNNASSNTDGTSGLFGLAGQVMGNNVNLYATTLALGDLDPTYLYGITDNLTFTTPAQAASEVFTVLATGPQDSNLRGLAWAPAAGVTIASSPSGLAFSSSGGAGCAPGSYTTPVTPILTPGSSCTLTVTSPQAGPAGTGYIFAQWEDGETTLAREITVPASPTTYTASFNNAYLLTTSAGTGGSVSAGGYIVAGTDATITATPSVGYYFVNFTGTTTSTSNPLTLTMNAPQTITANFAAQTTPTITWPAPAAITFGGALGNGQLDATASVPGTFVYSPAAGTVLPVGNNEPLAVTFLPTDTIHYTTATASTTITVNPAPASGANLVVTKVLTRTGGNVVVTLTIANTGGTAAANVVLSSVKVGADTATPLPQTIGTIGAGASATATVSVPGSVGASGAASSLTLSGTYTGGTFSSSARITLP